ncbi:MAG TPA: thioredoxin domain-containing protein [Waddliaceae bacterium]
MAYILKPPRLLFWGTFFLLSALSTTIYFSRSQLPPSIPISTRGDPTLGYAKARVHVVVFEEPKCSHCRIFNADIFPVIKKEFIDTNKIRYTIVPVSFLPGSMPAAIATLCVYYENSLYPNDTLFFKYLDYIYQHQTIEKVDWSTPEKLVEFAQATSPAIELKKLKTCIERESYRVQIEKNTEYGQEVMGGTLITPAVFVNGIRLKDISLEEVRKLIKEVLDHEGVYD